MDTRVTTDGNVFYTHKAKKESVWTVPEEIRKQSTYLRKKRQRRRNGRNEKLS